MNIIVFNHIIFKSKLLCNNKKLVFKLEYYFKSKKRSFIRSFGRKYFLKSISTNLAYTKTVAKNKCFFFKLAHKYYSTYFLPLQPSDAWSSSSLYSDMILLKFSKVRDRLFSSPWSFSIVVTKLSILSVSTSWLTISIIDLVMT